MQKNNLFGLKKKNGGKKYGLLKNNLINILVTKTTNTERYYMFNINKIMEIMKHANIIQSQMQKKLKKKKITGSSCAGLINITMNGYFEVIKLKIDANNINVNDIELLQDMIKSATNDATSKIKNIIIKEIKSITKNNMKQ
jgi:hypothetical protein